jgi:hypothetical protein
MMSDPVASKSTFLKMYMSSHPDTLVAYVKFYGEIQETVTGAEMTAIDSKARTDSRFDGGTRLMQFPIEHDAFIQGERSGGR